jgi:hypothetical protein
LKVFPTGIDSVEILRKNSELEPQSLGWVKVEKEVFNLDFKSLNIHKGETIQFSLWGQVVKGGVIEKKIDKFDYFTPTIW